MMICEQCGRRFGTIGKNYWAAVSGICPLCKGKPILASYFVTQQKEEK